MPNPENIVKHKFKKGQTGNLNGRPKGVRNRSTIVKHYLEALITQTNALTGNEDTLPASDLMTLKLIKTVLEKGDVQAFKELMDSGYGTIAQNLNLGNVDEEKPLTIILTKKN
jgi:hypothetical protein